MITNFCLPIIEEDVGDIDKRIRTSAGYSYYEIWLDYIRDLDSRWLDKISKQYPQSLIFLLRRKELEQPQLSAERSTEILRALSQVDCLIDLDISSQQSELNYLKEHGLKGRLICSYHNYVATDGESKLLAIYESMKNYDPFIYKFSCFCAEEWDALRLLQLLLKIRSDGKEYTVLGMGEKALITRVFGPLWGNYLTFAPLSADRASARGQLTLAQYKQLLPLLAPTSAGDS